MDDIRIDDLSEDEFLDDEDDLLGDFMGNTDELLDIGDITDLGKEVIETLRRKTR